MFFAIGFETTAPSTALTLVRAKNQGIHNFSVFCNHVTIIPAIRAILDSPDMRIDAFIGPGHVSTVIGCRPYEWIAKNENKPVAVSGFEPLDILQSIVMVLRQLRATRRRSRINTSAWCLGREIAPRCARWRTFSSCAPILSGEDWASSRSQPCASGISYAEWDAEQRFEVPGVRVTDPKAAQCGEVLKGVLKPHQCKLFGKECTPEHPIGALMVSSEGSCAAYFNYEHRKTAMVTSISVGGVSVAATNSGSQLTPEGQNSPQDPLSRAADRNGARSRRQSQPQTGRRSFCSASFRIVFGIRAAGRCGPSRFQRHPHRNHHRQFRRQAAEFSRRFHRRTWP
jgi:hydrogenase expression/formation protein HypD